MVLCGMRGRVSIGYGVNPDVNNGDTRGFDVWPMTVHREENLRWDAARAYYYLVEDWPDLTLLRGTVAKMVWEAPDGGETRTATGVEYVDANNKTTVIDGQKEVVLSAGSLRTPLILDASGVGNPK